MLHITPDATRELLRAAARSDAGDLPLRIAAQHRDDGGIDVGMGFDDEREQDHRLELDGLTVLLGARSRELLDDAVLDFVETAPGQHGFVFAPAGAPAPSEDAAPRGGCGSGGCSRCGG